MSIAFHPYTPTPLSDPCAICHEELAIESVAHGTENFHQMCKKCARAWLITHPNCPVCNVPISDISLFLSKKERVFIWIRNTGDTFLNNHIVNFLNRGKSIALLGSLFPALPSLKGETNLWLTTAGIISGTLTGFFAAHYARIEKKEAAFISAFLISLIIMNGEELISAF